MGLSSSLYTGTSGLINMGNSMQVVSNNIANSSTVGFKKGISSFADTLSQSVATQSGVDQVGRGMSLGEVAQDFTQGSFESTGNVTDMAIGGDGYFIVADEETDAEFYTRAGNFHFDEDGQLVNANGYIVQGWTLDNETGDNEGAITDIIMDSFTSPPEQSSELTVITNLDADAVSEADVLANFWDATEDDTYIDGTLYEYQTVVQVYDSLGSTHDVSIYYDKISDSKWEYIVTCDPEEDQRELVQGTSSEGLLARGTLTFSESSGDIVNITMSELTGRIGNMNASGINEEEDIHFTIEDSDTMLLDGYGFSLEFDGAEWQIAHDDPTTDPTLEAPAAGVNYDEAEILYSDSQSIYIKLNNDDDEADLKITLDQISDTGDTISFDINAAEDLHVQGVEGSQFIGETDNGNTTIEVRDPSVMTIDEEEISIVWYPEENTWRWGNPDVAAENDDLIPDVDYNGTGYGFTAGETTPSSVNTADASAMTYYVEDISLTYDAATTSWEWNMPFKESGEDIVNEDLDLGIVDAERTITSGSLDGAYADMGDYEFTYDEIAGTWSSTGAVTPTITTNTSTALEFTLASGTTILYEFDAAVSDNDLISFTVDPSPPKEYDNATLTAGTDVGIDFNGDGSDDLMFDLTTAGVPAGGETFIFTLDPNSPPEEYQNATLIGDSEQAMIDLDGSGGEEDSDDIVFTFDDPLDVTGVEEVSSIEFSISGSTAWREIDTDELEETGYFAFTTDFLGGEDGSTENKIQLNLGAEFDGTNFQNDSLSTTQYAKASSTTFQTADGYAAGDLEEVDVATDGTITGIYSNGELIPLYRVALAQFNNDNGLTSAGGNLYQETRESGDAITNSPGLNGLGTISPSTLEMSNVDISEEFVQMITTQRGFQANSKTVTTVDSMMETVINMKR